MMDASFIDKLDELLSSEKARAQIMEESGSSAVALHANCTIRDLEKYMPHKRRFQAHMRTSEVESFTVYAVDMGRQVNPGRPGEADNPVPVFVDADAMSAMAVFDLGNVMEPLHAENRATVTLEKTAEFREVLKRNGDSAKQRTFAEWLEDWRHCITVYDHAGEELTFAAAVAAVRKYEVSEKNEAGSEEKSFSTRKTAMSEVNAKNADKLPAFIDFTCSPYKELDERTFKMRVSIVNGSDPVFTPRIIQLELAEQEIANEFCELLRDSLSGHDEENKDLFTVLIGSI